MNSFWNPAKHTDEQLTNHTEFSNESDRFVNRQKARGQQHRQVNFIYLKPICFFKANWFLSSKITTTSLSLMFHLTIVTYQS